MDKFRSKKTTWSFFTELLFLISLPALQALGNHEFDNGVDGLMTPFLRQVRFPVLSANIVPDPSLAPTFGTSYSPFKIFSVGGQRVAVVGYTSQETPALSRPGEGKRTPSSE